MNELFIWSTPILVIICAALMIKLLLIKKTAKEIIKGVREKISGDTNTLIDISSGDRDMRRLASDLNVQLSRLREEKICCQQGDIKLKDDVTNISHDLRTPLTAICGYLEMLKREEQTAQSRRYLEIVGERTAAMRQLTEELLKYSVAVSEEHIQHEIKDVVINNVLEECVSGFYAVLTENNIFPEIDICEEKIHRMLNSNALARVFSNIISNAVKYSDGDLKIVLAPDGAVSFSNAASGLDAITVGRLFDRFYTVETGERSTGLGLSIAKALTEQMGGTINASYQEQRVVIKITF